MKSSDAAMSRRKLLGAAGAAAVTGLVFGGRRAWARPSDQDDGVDKMKAYVDEEVQRIQVMKKPFTNTDGAVTQLINTGLTYVNRENIVYGNTHTLFSVNTFANAQGKFELDCSSFVQACVTGTTYENSRYLNATNTFNEAFYPLINENPIVARLRGHRMLAHEIGKYCYDHGMSFKPNYDWSNVRVGDLVFLYNSPVKHFWNAIGHVMIVSRLNQDKTITFIESVSKRPSAAVESTYTLEELNGRKKAFLCGRIPLHDTTVETGSIGYDTYQASKALERPVFTTEKLKPNVMYTLFFRGDFPKGSYPVIRLGPDESDVVYSFGRNVMKRPDGMYKVNFFIPEGTAKYDNRLDIVVENGDKPARIDFVALYPGYVTTCPPYVAPVVRSTLQTSFRKSIVLSGHGEDNVSFEQEVRPVLDDRYYVYADVSVLSDEPTGLVVSLGRKDRYDVHVLNVRNKTVAVDVQLTITQFLK